jgi:hypothetical protein
MAKYVNPTPVNNGGGGKHHWEYFFAQKTPGGKWVMVIRDMNNHKRPPCELGVDEDFVTSHEKQDGAVRNRAQELAADCLDGRL